MLDGEPIAVSGGLLEPVGQRRDALLRHLETGVAAYGVTTGLGYLASETIGDDDQAALQRSLLTARASGLGLTAPRRCRPRRDAAQARGLLERFPGCDARALPVPRRPPQRGLEPRRAVRAVRSLGEISPLAHLFQTFIGEGLVELDGEPLPAREALARVGTEPYDPAVKEGVALLNGSPFATALGVRLGDLGTRLLDQATVAAALAVAVVGASARPFAARVVSLGHDDAEQRVGRRLLRAPTRGCAVGRTAATAGLLPRRASGARRRARALDELRARSKRGFARSPTAPSSWMRKVTSPRACTRPADSTPIASRCASRARARAAQVTNLVEKRLHRLLDARFSGLPEQLAADPGVQSGPCRCTRPSSGWSPRTVCSPRPASIHAIDTSTGQEDVQALTFLAADSSRQCWTPGAGACLRARGAPAGARTCGSGPRRPLLERVVAQLAEVVAPIDEDRTLTPDVERVRALLRRAIASLVDEREEAPQHPLARGCSGRNSSGWNCVPHQRRIGSAIAWMAQTGLDASARNPGGSTVISWS